MAPSRREFLLTALAGALSLQSPVLLATAEPEVGDDGLHEQPWFLETFLEMSDDLSGAADEGRRFAVIWEQKGCPYCRELHRVNFADAGLVDYFTRHFSVVQLNLWGAREVTDFDGEVLEERELARKWRVNYTPTVQFFPADLTGKEGQDGVRVEVARMPGYFKPFHFRSMLEFVNTSAYERMTFQRFLQVKFEELKGSGKSAKVW
ncbi:MAG: thioredoxin fold domain-containing protein [Gammaproteobacteria bacterium]|nr:thioredoxin fold domain-containing protein [Gammaproteobacteria bacterium]